MQAESVIQVRLSFFCLFVNQYFKLQANCIIFAGNLDFKIRIYLKYYFKALIINTLFIK